MSSLFSYELDEEQIRLTLQNSGAVEYTESSWDDFDSNYNQTIASQNQTRFKLPEFNLNINRNVVLPVIFITGLVGVSAIMLSFIDFKTNAPQQVQKEFIPDPENIKPEASRAAVLVKKQPQKAAQKPSPKTDSVAKKVEVPVIATKTQVAVYTHAVNSNTVYHPPVNNQVADHSKMAVTDTASKTANPLIISNLNSNYQGKNRKRHHKITNEQIETIKAPSVLGLETTTSEKEPELEIKLE